MTKQELEQKIKELQKQLDELKNVKIEEKQKKWKPAVDEEYYFIDTCGEIHFYNFNNDNIDNGCISFGNCFKTEAEAQFVADKIKYTKMFEDYIEEHSDPIDWDDDTKIKWCINYDFIEDCIDIDCVYNLKYQGTIYASSKQILQGAVAYVGEDNVKTYILGV